MSDYQDAASIRKTMLMSGTMGSGMTPIHPTSELFTGGDVDQALLIFDTAPMGMRREAIREVMMHALRCAAINLDVK